MNLDVGQIINGAISGIKPYGIFIKFEDTFGFCHISNCSHKFIKNLNDLFVLNQKVTAKIIEIDNSNNRINVSIKECENNESFKVKKIKEIKQPAQFKTKESVNNLSFEDMLKTYLKTSDEQLESIGKRNQKHRKR